jgi:hypothetical protein
MDVQIGQLWVDNDPRLAQEGRKRYVRVTGFLRDTAGDKAVCQAWYDEVGAACRTVRIRLDRFRPNASGYRLATNDEYARECPLR